MPHCRQPARHAGGFEASGVEVSQIVPQHVRAGTCKALPLAAEKVGQIGEVAPVGIERVDTSPLFRREHVEEQADQFVVFGRLAGTHCPRHPACEMSPRVDLSPTRR
jgi:hypothetical protein